MNPSSAKPLQTWSKGQLDQEHSTLLEKVCYGLGAVTHQLLIAEHQLDIFISRPHLHWSTVSAFVTCFNTKVSQLNKSCDSWAMSAEVTAPSCLWCPHFKGHLLPAAWAELLPLHPGHQGHVNLCPDSSLQVAKFKAICSWFNQDVRVTDPATVPKCTHTGWVPLDSPSSFKAGLKPLLQVSVATLQVSRSLLQHQCMQTPHQWLLHAQHGLCECKRH